MFKHVMMSQKNVAVINRDTLPLTFDSFHGTYSAADEKRTRGH